MIVLAVANMGDESNGRWNDLLDVARTARAPPTILEQESGLLDGNFDVLQILIDDFSKGFFCHPTRQDPQHLCG